MGREYSYVEAYNRTRSVFVGADFSPVDVTQYSDMISDIVLTYIFWIGAVVYAKLHMILLGEIVLVSSICAFSFLPLYKQMILLLCF